MLNNIPVPGSHLRQQEFSVSYTLRLNTKSSQTDPACCERAFDPNQLVAKRTCKVHRGYQLQNVGPYSMPYSMWIKLPYCIGPFQIEHVLFSG